MIPLTLLQIDKYTIVNTLIERGYPLTPQHHVTCHMLHVTCHMSCVMCHMSRVTCYMSHVTCHFFLLLFLDKVVKLIGGGSVINGAYPV